MTGSIRYTHTADASKRSLSWPSHRLSCARLHIQLDYINGCYARLTAISTTRFQNIAISTNDKTSFESHKLLSPSNTSIKTSRSFQYAGLWYLET